MREDKEGDIEIRGVGGGDKGGVEIEGRGRG